MNIGKLIPGLTPDAIERGWNLAERAVEALEKLADAQADALAHERNAQRHRMTA